jgi:SNF2 family DNA or RNA helicase
LINTAANKHRFDIVITTYNTLGSDYIIDKKDPANIELGPSLKAKWHRLVLDEAHCIKNRKTRSAKACFALKAKVRWALSGTPIQNSLDDMYSLICFLRYDPYADYSIWKGSILLFLKKLTN